MYLAEDRILCYELIAKKGCDYVLKYVSEAVAVTDVPESLDALIKQRKRWLNGSLFALVYAILGWKQMIQHSKHSLTRKILLSIQFLYFGLNVLLQWTSVANYYLTFYFLVRNLNISTMFTILRYVFLALLIIQFVLGLGNKPGRMKNAYSMSAFFLGLFSLTILALSLYQIIIGSLGTFVLMSLVASFGSMLIVGILFKSIFELMASFLQYTYFTATWVIIFPIYSLCNIHDVSWGTKNCNNYCVVLVITF